MKGLGSLRTLGQKSLLQAAYLNGAPHHTLGRPVKAGKEEIMAKLPRYVRVNTLKCTFAEAKRELKATKEELKANTEELKANTEELQATKEELAATKAAFGERMAALEAAMKR